MCTKFRNFRLVEFVEFNYWKRSIGPPGIRICKKFCNRSIFSICFPFLKFLKRKKPACRRSRTTAQKLFLFRPKNSNYILFKICFMSNQTRWFRIREYFCNKNMFSIFFRLLKTLDDKIIVKYCKLNFHAIYIFVQRIFLNIIVFFNYFLSAF